MVVYAVLAGSDWEGGRVEELYDSEEKAIKFATMKVHQFNQENIEIHGPNTEYDYVEKDPGNWVKYWASCIYYIGVSKMEVK